MTLSIQGVLDTIRELKEKELSLNTISPEQVDGYLRHIHGTAYIAKAIALEIPEMDPHQIYRSALLHDLGRLEEPRVHRFHGLLGYERLKDKDEDAARIALVHMFPYDKLPPFEECSHWFFGKQEDYDFVANYLNNTEPREEDLLVQLADSLANKDGFVTLQERFDEYQKRHGETLSKQQVFLRYQLKSHFDEKIGRSVYKLFPKKSAQRPLPIISFSGYGL